MRRTTALRLILVLYLAALATGTHWPRLQIDTGAEPIFGQDKWLHVIAFGGLAVLFLAAQIVRVRTLGRFLAATGLIGAYALIDELTQMLVPGRTGSIGDLAASLVGVIIGGVGWLITHDLRRPSESFIHHARTMSILTLASRLLGLLRDWSLAFALGFGWAYDGFVVAFMIPNLFRRLFGEGALAAAFIPHYARLHQRDATSADRFAAWIVRTLGRRLLIAAGVICAAALIWTVFLDNDPALRDALAAPLTALTIWYMPLVCVLAILGAVLQVHKRFGIPSAAPILLNVAIILAALLSVAQVGARQPLVIVIMVSAAVVIAGVLQVAWALWGVRRAGVALPWWAPRARPGDDPEIREARRGMYRQWLPMTLGLAVFQVNVLLDVLIAKFLSGEPGETFTIFGRAIAYPMEHGAVAVLGSTARLYEFPLGVFGIAVATAIYPALSRLSEDASGFTSLVRQGLRLTVFIGLPASLGLLLVRQPLAQTIYYDHGAIDERDAARVAWVLLGYAPAVWAYSMNQMLTRVFYAKDDARTPMRITIGIVGLNLLLNLSLVWVPAAGNPTGNRLGVAGLAWSTAICAVLQCIAMVVLAARRHVARPIDRPVLIGWARTALATGGMAVVTWLIVARGPGWVGLAAARLTHAQTAAWLAGATLAGAGVFFVTARLLGMAELRWVTSRRTPNDMAPTDTD